jgi:4a-hydroxytetrahydrobiopterin dehydratase
MSSSMQKKSSLSDKICVPCQGGISSLNEQEVRKLLAELQGSWEINTPGHLYKKFEFSDFVSALNFVNQIGNIAERESHHPDMFISWGICAVEIWTHKINGLTESDFILAAKIDTIAR